MYIYINMEGGNILELVYLGNICMYIYINMEGFNNENYNVLLKICKTNSFNY